MFSHKRLKIELNVKGLVVFSDFQVAIIYVIDQTYTRGAYIGQIPLKMKSSSSTMLFAMTASLKQKCLPPYSKTLLQKQMAG